MNENEKRLDAIKKEIERVASFGPLLANQMTLRDYFAIHAPDAALRVGFDSSYEDQAGQRYEFADAMMKARNAT